MTRDEDSVPVLAREHAAPVKAHAERRDMRSEQRDRVREFITRAAPVESRVGEVALVAIRRAEILVRLADAVELVAGRILTASRGRCP
jgi:hypothetical protein